MKSKILMVLLFCSIALITADNAYSNELIQQANTGDAEAQCFLVVMYMTIVNMFKAVEWFRKAVDQGNASTQVNLGLMYKHGEGIKQN